MPTTTEVPAYAPTGIRLPEADFALRAFQRDVLTGLGDAGLALVDVRSPAEYAGEVIAPPGMSETAQRAGHIPGAVSAPWAQTVNEDGTFKSADELRAHFAAKGVTADKDVIDLLPHRRAGQPHLVRAPRAAGLPARAQLRRLVDGVGLRHRRAHREPLGHRPPRPPEQPAAVTA